MLDGRTRAELDSRVQPRRRRLAFARRRGALRRPDLCPRRTDPCARPRRAEGDCAARAEAAERQAQALPEHARRRSSAAFVSGNGTESACRSYPASPDRCRGLCEGRRNHSRLDAAMRTSSGAGTSRSVRWASENCARRHRSVGLSAAHRLRRIRPPPWSVNPNRARPSGPDDQPTSRPGVSQLCNRNLATRVSPHRLSIPLC